ncbi:MAG: hypothetical protein ABIL05_04765 [candidate division WOR-3 bacterium]
MIKKLIILLTLTVLTFLYCPKSENNQNLSFEIVCRDDSIKTYNSPPPSIIYFHLTISNTGTDFRLF